MGGSIRVLHSVVNMNRGGAETLIMNIYRNLDRSQVQFDFLTCKEGVFDAEIRSLGGVIHRIPYVTEAGHFRYVRALNDFFAAHSDYRVVHSHMDKMSGFVLRAAKKAGIPNRIAHSHNTESEGGLPARTYKWYAGLSIVPNATHLLACSEQAAKWLFDAKQERSILLKNGIESRKFLFSPQIRAETRGELGLSADSFAIGHVGRFNHQKNHDFLLHVFAAFTKVRPNAVLLLAGDGPLRVEIERKICKLGIDGKVKLLGTRPDIHRLLQAFDVFAFPSRHEGMPVTLVEAQAAGLPCLISDRITREADLEIGLVQFLPLDRKPLWLERLQVAADSRPARVIPKDALAAKGYDICDSANWTNNFYQTISGMR